MESNCQLGIGFRIQSFSPNAKLQIDNNPKLRIPKGTKGVALISVYNKTGIVDFAKALIDMGWFILSSGGTAKALREAGLKVTDVADLVGGSAILGHRVVTLSREIHAGLLARFLKQDIDEMAALGWRC